VDLVLCGHDHDYERSYAVRGTDPGTFQRPTVVSFDTEVVDTSEGLVHIVLGGGGTSSQGSRKRDRTCDLVGSAGPQHHVPVGRRRIRRGPWPLPGDRTSITFTYYHTPAATTSDLNPAPIAYDSFTAVRRGRDAFFGSRTDGQVAPAHA
jgi:hypothetical protein